jgi:hypothetical protein
MILTYKDILKRSGDLFIYGDLKKLLDYYYIGNNNSIFYINNWSIIHFISGIIISLILKYIYKQSRNEIIIKSFIIHCIWEIWQIIILNTYIYKLRDQIDTLNDTILFMIGVLLIIYL